MLTKMLSSITLRFKLTTILNELGRASLSITVYNQTNNLSSPFQLQEICKQGGDDRKQTNPLKPSVVM